MEIGVLKSTMFSGIVLLHEIRIDCRYFATIVLEVFAVSKKKNQYSKRRNDTSINPQGLTEDVEDQQPKSQLEQRAKKKNTKI